MKKKDNKKLRTLIWLLAAGVLLALSLFLRFGVDGAGNLPYELAGASMLMVLWSLRRSWLGLSGLLLFLALILRFALRGYNYWGYAMAFLALLIVIHRFAPAWLWRTVVILVCLGLVYFCAVEVPIVKNARTDKDPERPYLVVLGAAVHGDEPSLTLIRRMQGALAYLEQYPESVAIVSGGQGPGENKSEAQVMFEWLCAQGVAPERIIREDRATSTLENMRYSFEIIRERGTEPDGQVAIVSSAYHLYRAKLMARSQGVEAAGVAAPWGYFFVMLNYFIREAFGVTHLWVFGR